MILETERLVLDTWQGSDWTELRPIATDVEVMRYITGGAPWTDEQIRAFVDRQMKLYSERKFCRWKLLRKPAREMIGFCGVGFWRASGGVRDWPRKRREPHYNMRSNMQG